LDNLFANLYLGCVKSIIKILPILFLQAFISFAQQTDNTQTISATDSLKIRINSNSLAQMQIKFDEFELHREFNNMKISVPVDGDPQTVWLRTSFAISNSDNADHNFSPHFLSPLEKQYLENSKFNPIRYALGMVQAGAVGYLAYRHIKKYGFLK